MKNKNLPSLLPYFENSETRVYLKLSLVKENSEHPPYFPFSVIAESGPYTRMVEAKFVTDGRSEVKKVFLVLQKDEYFLTENELWPVTNKDISQCWQKAFSNHLTGKDESDFIVLADQAGKDGELLPFHPLFYCKQKHVFFHPPCPKCGAPLEQCLDDDRLAVSGLRTYSASIKRYLFCPSCSDKSDKPDFYIYSLENSGPEFLKDRFTLIKEFGQLNQGPDTFPCQGCPEHGECFETGDMAVSRIVPFAFYPFYMLIFEAESLNALDFLFLVSGASVEEVEDYLNKNKQFGRLNSLIDFKRNARVTTPFFFDNRQRYFLEVLYLKLSFLDELVRNIFSGIDSYQYPDLALSVDRIWVKLADEAGPLPFFWNFKVKPLDLGGRAVQTLFFPASPPSYGLYFLGSVWFFALLVNKKQGVADAHAAVEQTIKKIVSDNGSSLENALKEGLSSVFSPENIFWDPESRPVREEWEEFWEKTLELGWSLLRASLSIDYKLSKEEFLRKLEGLRQEIKEHLFIQPPADEQTLPTPDTKGIHDILKKIIARWTDSFEKNGKLDVSEDPAASDGWDEIPMTVVRSHENNENETSRNHDQEIPAQQPAAENISEPSDSQTPAEEPAAEDIAEPSDSQTDGAGWDEIPMTVVQPRKDGKKNAPAEKIPMTVIQPRKNDKQEAPAEDIPVEQPSTDQQTAGWDEMPMTVVQARKDMKKEPVTSNFQEEIPTEIAPLDKPFEEPHEELSEWDDIPATVAGKPLTDKNTGKETDKPEKEGFFVKTVTITSDKSRKKD
ncbi:MAG: hypothetical protein GY795_04490 [Desulfobacterales bacterium]|nr:hypothetical protein [Desulfobacterales bacterium]